MSKEKEMYNFKSSCGIDPEFSEMTFNLTTDDAYKFLSDQLSVLLETLRAKKKYNLPDNASEFKMISFDAVRLDDQRKKESGKNYTPFVVMLPTSLTENAAKKGKNSQDDDKVNEVYKVNENDGTQKLLYEVFQWIKMYMYTEEDKEAFRSPRYRSELGISGKMAETLVSYCKPVNYNIGKDDNGNRGVRFIALLIDPMRVFHKMLVNKTNPNEQFKLKIKYVEKIRDGVCKYEMVRIRSKHKGRTTADFEKALLRGIRGVK